MDPQAQPLESTQRLRRLSVEARFIRARPHLPCEREFACRMRDYLVAGKLEWTDENLQKAAEHVLPGYLAALRRAALLRSLRSIL